MNDQIKTAIEDQNASFAIDGAIEYGRLGINPPPSDDHWLMPYWKIGQQLALTASADSAQDEQFPVSNTLGGFRGGFIGVHGRAPTEQEIWNAAVRSGMDRASNLQAGEPIPFEAIGKILNEVMELAVKNGANSISMPDEYVAVSHFLSFPEKYTAPPSQQAGKDAQTNTQQPKGETS